MRYGIVSNALRGPLEEAPAAAARAGYDGVEWSIAQGFGEDRFWDPAVRAEIGRRAADAGVALSSAILSIVGKIDFPDDAGGRRQCRELILAAIDACAELGIKVMMVPCLKKARATPLDQIARAAEDFHACGPAASKAGVTLGVEDMITAEQNLDFFRAIDHPAVKLYYDIGNSLRYGLDPYQEVEVLGALICQHHIKDAPITPPPDASGRPATPALLLGDGEADWPRFLRAVRRTGFDGWYVFETKPVGDDPVGTAAENLRRFRALLEQTAPSP